MSHVKSLLFIILTLFLFSDHYRILSSGYLLIRNLTSHDQGQYRCIAVNPVSNQNRTSSHMISLSVRRYTVGKSCDVINRSDWMKEARIIY
jgi:hypothetical protein